MLSQLTVRLGLDAAEFTGGLTKSEYQAKKFVQNTTASIKSLAGGLTLATGGAVAFLAALDKAAGTIATYKDLADQMGASSESVAALQSAADLSGVAINTVADASVKLTSALSKTDDEAKGTGAALKALGLNLPDFKKLGSVEQLEAIATQMDRFADGTGKTATAVALFGRSGAQLIPFLNDLAEAGGKNVRLTEDQIEAADKFTKELARMRSELGLLSQSIIADVLPTFNDLQEKFNSLRKSNVGVIDSLVGSLLPGLAKKNLEQGISFYEKEIQRLQDAIANPPKSLGDDEISLFLQRRNEQLDKAKTGLADLLRQQNLLTGITTTKLPVLDDPLAVVRPALKFSDTGGGDKKVSDAERYIESLKKTEAQLANLSQYEQLMWDVSEGRLGAVTQKQLDYAIAIAKSNDATKEHAEDQKTVKAVLDDLTKAQSDQEARTKRITEQLVQQAEAWLDLADPMRKFIKDLEEIDSLVSKNILTEGQAKMIRQNLGDRTEKGADGLDQYAINAAKNMQSAFADFLFDPFKDGLDGMLDNFGKIIQRMVAEVAAAELMKFLLGDYTKTGVVGGVIGGVIGQKASGGPVDAYTPYLVGERGPELFMPSGAGNIVPNHALGGGGQTIVQHITIQGAPQSAPERDQLQRVLRNAVRGELSMAGSRNSRLSR